MGTHSVDLKPVECDERARCDFERLRNPEPHLFATLGHAAAADEAQFLGVFVNGERIGTAVFSYLEAERALVCNVLACEPIDAPVVPELTRIAEGWAQEIGAKVLRLWTQRAGLVRLMEVEGFQKTTVMEKTIGQ